jgi:VanZ family protein
MASAAIEFAQVYFPSRTVSPRDVVAETVGGAIGGALWLAAGPWLTRRARARASIGGGLAAWLLPAYLLALILSHVMPLDITISPSDIYHKYRDGMICLMPFSAAARGFSEFERRIVDEAASFLIVGLFLGRSDPWRARGPWSLLSLGLVLAGTIEALQLFIASRRCDSTDVIVGGLAVLGGWAAGRATLPTAAHQARLACFAGWLGLVAFSSWFPFDFVADPRFWLDKASKVTALPFADYYHGSVWNAADQIFRKAVLFFPLGMVSDRGWRGTLLAASGLAILFEVGQLGLPGREPSVTDVLIEIGGAWAGLSLGGLRPSTHRDGVEY